MRQTTGKKIAVIGAGPAGLCTAKNLAADGHQPVIFEKKSQLGGIWIYDLHSPGGVYDTTQYQTTRFVSCFSDFPFPETTSVFPTHEEVLAYLNSYADHFDIRKYCRLNTPVSQVLPWGSQWKIICTGEHAGEYLFDAVAICTGQYWHPRPITLPGASSFTGELYHSVFYKNNAAFRNKNVVVAGSGVSGMDIAVEAAKTGQTVNWCVREKNWIKPRWFGFIPYEAGVTEGVHLSREEMLASWEKGIPDFLAAYRASGLIPDRPPFVEGFCANDEILFLIRDNRIKVRPPIRELSGNQVVFEDGSRAEADIVVMATGYQEMHFPWLDATVVAQLQVHNEGMDLYHHVFHPKLQNLAFIFHVAGNAPAMPVIDLQSRWVSKIWSGEMLLPEQEMMEKAIAEDKTRKQSQLNQKRYRSNFIDGAYVQQLAEMLNLLPDKTTHWKEYLETIAPPSFPMIYRLFGEQAWAGAPAAIAQARKRYPLKSDHLQQLAEQTLQRCTPAELLLMFKNKQISREVLTQALVEKKKHAGESTGRPQPQATHTPATINSDPEPQHNSSLVNVLIELISELLKIDASELDAETDMSEYGFDSISLAAFAKKLKEKLGIEVSPSVFFGYTTIASFAGYLKSKGIFAEPLVPQTESAPIPVAPEPVPVNPVFAEQPQAAIKQASPIPAITEPGGPPASAVAIIGIDAVLPNAATVNEYWNILRRGENTARTIPESRFKWEDYRHWLDDASALQWGSFIPQVSGFDADYFNIAEKEAVTMDPQQRLLLQSVVHAIENAGYTATALAERKTGVFIAASAQDYKELIAAVSGTIEINSLAGLSPNMLANRISFLFNFQGPSEVIDTACSGFLVAIHRAVQAIQQGDCETAIVGGVNLLLTPTVFISLAKAGLLSADGACKSFSRNANGYVRGEGLGVVVLKSSRQAIQDRDHIYAHIRGTGVNHNGRLHSVFTPNPAAQTDLIAGVIRKSGVNPQHISYIEGQGTGSMLGDETECRAISQAFAQLGVTRPNACGLGTAKTNIGNLEAASGVASLVKVLLAMQHKILPASPGLHDPNPNLELANGSLYLVAREQEWRPVNDATPVLFAGINAFGFGGTNAHIVLESGQTGETFGPAAESNGPFIIVLSARSENSLQQMKQELAQFVENTPHPLSHIAYTLQTGREELPLRFAAVVNTRQELVQALRQSQAFAACWHSVLKTGGGMTKALQKNNYAETLLAQMLQNNDYKSIAQLWTEGMSIPWVNLYAERPSRIPLPAYVFNESIFWVNGQQPTAPAPASVKETGTAGTVTEILLRTTRAILPASCREQLSETASLAVMGVDSLGILELREALSRQCGVSLTSRELFEADNIAAIARLAGSKMNGNGVTGSAPLRLAKVENPFPLSIQQKAISFIYELAPDSATYNNLLAIKVNTHFDQTAFTKALHELVRQQPALRTRLVYVNGVQQQYAENQLQPDMQFASFTHTHQNAAEQYLEQEYRAPFNLAVAPLWKVRVLNLAGEESILAVIIHHIIFDGSSSLALIHQLITHYYCARYGEPFRNFTEQGYFQHFLQEQEQTLASPVGEKYWQYWKQELAHAPTILQLPEELPRPAMATYGGRRIETTWNPEFTRQLQECAVQSGITFNNLLLGAFFALLFKHARQNDILVGIPSAGRSSKWLHLIGYFVNMLVIRIQRHPGTTIAEMMQQVQQKVLHALDNEGLPFAELVRRLQLERDFSRSPLFQACFVYQSWYHTRGVIPNESFRHYPGFKPIQMEPLLLDQQNGQFDIRIEVLEKDGECMVELKYNTDIFRHETMLQWFGEYRQILDSLLKEGLNRPVTALLNGPLTEKPVINGHHPVNGIAQPALPPAAASAPAEIEEKVIGIFRQVMQRDTILPDDNFFALGGHSILAVQMMAALRKTFKVPVSVVDIINNPSVKGLTGWISMARNGEKAAVTPAPPAQQTPVIAQTDSGPFPLSDMQQAFWTGQQGFFELGTTQPHLYIEYEDAHYDMEKFNLAWRKVLRRHDMLRVQFLADGWQQITGGADDFTVPFKDLRSLSETEQENAILAFREECRNATTGFEEWPFTLAIQRKHDKDVLHCKISLLICDGVSLGLIFKDLFRYYFDAHYAPAPLGYTFRQYIHDIGELKTSEEYRQHKAYWANRIASLPLAPELPVLSARQQQAMRMTRQEMYIPAEQWASIKSLAAANGLMVNSVLCTAYTRSLAYWSKTPHFSIVVMYFNRRPLHADVPLVVGNFEIPSLLEIDFTTKRSFTEEARTLQETLLTDVEHNLYSGIDVLRDLSLAHGQVGRAVVPITFSSGLNIIDQKEVLYKSSGQMRYTSLQVPQVWIDHQVYDEPDGTLKVVFDVVEELFPATTIADMMNAYRNLLQQLAAQAEQWQQHVPPMLPARQQLIIDEANRTARPIPPGFLYDPFVHAARQWPDSVALIDGEESFSFETINKLSNRVAHYFWKKNVQPNELVAIIINKGWEQAPAAIGIMKSGGAYLPLDVKMPLSRMEFIIQKAGVRHAVVTSEVLAEGLTVPAGVEILNITNGVPGEPESEPAPIHEPTHLAYVIFTSGSTGFPKGVMIDHRGALNTVTYINERYGVTRNDRSFAISSLYFDLSVYDLFGVLGAGGSLVFPNYKRLRDPEHWIEEITKHRVTLWNSVPELMNLVVEFGHYMDDFFLPDLKYVMMSGDWIPVTLPERIRKVAPQAKQISYGGATEASIWSIYYDINEVDPEWKSIPYGKALENQTMHVLNPFLEPCPIGVVGDIYIGGIGVAKGYLNDPDKTAAQFIHSPQHGGIIYKTGDIGRLLPDGNIEFLGRADFQVKIQGYRIELGEIEAVMLRHPGIKMAAADVKKDATGTNLLVGYYVCQQADITEQEIIRHLSQSLQDYMVPRLMVKMAELPLTNNGKVDRKQLPLPESLQPASRSAEPDAAELMAKPQARQLAEIWKTVLKSSDVQMNDSFFEKGGNSLLAIRMKVNIEKQLGVTFPISKLFEHARFADLVKEICGQIKTAIVPESLIPIHKTGRRKPLFLIHPIGGSVYTYTRLVRLLNTEQPVYAFQAIGLDSEKNPVSSIPEMASQYIQEMKTIQPQGPYLLGGWSFGGIVCFEMTRQLEAMGEQVQKIFLIDSYFNQFHLDYRHMPEKDLLAYYLKDLAMQSVQHFNVQGASTDALIDAAIEAGVLPFGVDKAYIRKLLSVFRANCIAYESYRPTAKISTSVWKFVAEDDSYLVAREEADLWNEVITGVIQETVVPGNHFTIFNDNHIRAISDAIDAALADVQPVSLHLNVKEKNA